MPSVLVIGGGTGAFAAASLARQGFQVTLIERSRGLLTGASARNGRRLHLGEHYSADVLPADDETSLNTGRLCFLGAFALADRFPGVIQRDPQWWQLLPADSMTPPDRYEEHLDGLRTFHRTLARMEPRVDELFGPAHQRHRRLSAREFQGVATAATAGYLSRESVMDLTVLRLGLMAALTSTQTRVALMTEVTDIRPRSGCYEATLRDVRTGDQVLRRYDYIVNATWHEIPKLSRMVHDGAAAPVTTRLKLFVTAPVPSALAAVPSLYFHRGVYGNHTNVAGRYAIVTAEQVSNISFERFGAALATWQPFLASGVLSATAHDQWAALGRLTEGDPAAGSTGGDRSRSAIREALRQARSADGEVRARLARRWLGREVLQAYAHLVPAFSEVDPLCVRFTTVVSEGDAHLADEKSGVHVRCFSVREVAPNFFTLDPGKLTLAQLAADYLCRCLMSRHRRRTRPPNTSLLDLLDEAKYPKGGIDE